MNDSAINKLPVFEWFLEQGDVLVSVDTSMDGVDIPPTFRGQKVVDFILGEHPTPGIKTDDQGVSAQMRFSENRYPCYFPWPCVIRISGEDAVIQFRAEKSSSKSKAPGKPARSTTNTKKQRGNLKIVR